MMAVLFPAEGNPVEIEYTGKLSDLQNAVNGYIERVQFDLEGRSFEAWVNEEGLLLGLPTNEFISDLIGFSFRNRDFTVVGNVLITAPAGGESRGLNEEEIGLFRSMWNARQMAMQLMAMIDDLPPAPPMHTLN